MVFSLFQKALRNYPSADVIDLGAHIGFHTLLAAKLGHRVLAVEPVSSSLRRIHHAALLSGVRKNITLFHNAIYNTRTYAWLRQPHGNIGGTNIVIADSSSGADKREAVRTILTDDLFPFIQRRITLIKVDIGTYINTPFILSELCLPFPNGLAIPAQWTSSAGYVADLEPSPGVQDIV